MTPEKIYEKQTGVPATYPFYVHSVGYVKWLEEQNAKLLEALKAYVSKFGDCGDTYEHARQAIAEAEGQS